MNPRRILLGMMIGAGAGLLAHVLAPGAPWVDWLATNLAMPIGQIFLRLLFMLVLPLVFSALVVGIASIEMRQLGRLGLRTLAYAGGLSFIAVTIGLFLVNLVQPGAGGSGQALRALARNATAPTAAPAPRSSAIELIVGMVPDNPIKAAATGDMIGVIVFALIFGVALALTRTEAALRLRQMMQGLYDVMMTCIEGVLKVAPVGVGALLFVMGVRLGAGFLGPLAAYVLVVLVGLSIHLFVVYSLLVWVVGRTRPRRFFRDVRLAMLTAFSTASSSATLPTALRVADTELRLPRPLSRFVLTVGSTMNQHGTALYEGVTVLFLAQMAGLDLTLSQQATVMIISVLAGIGTAGVSAGSLPVMAMILSTIGVPPEGLGLILGVDRLLDMCRTTLNVTGDLAVAVAIARGERVSAVVQPAAGTPPAVS
jgi:DAACS family dicarboxylate/amino acid:cation (Na+ or H+) symporter